MALGLTSYITKIFIFIGKIYKINYSYIHICLHDEKSKFFSEIK